MLRLFTPARYNDCRLASSGSGSFPTKDELADTRGHARGSTSDAARVRFDGARDGDGSRHLHRLPVRADTSDRLGRTPSPPCSRLAV